MADYGKLLVHPAADEIPLFDDARRADLVASIRQHGQRRPIILTADGKQIIDGRNRYLACVEAGCKPKFKRFRKGASDVDIIDFIQIENLDRRDLTPGQRALVFLALEKRRGNAMQAEGKQRMRQGGRMAGRGRPKKGGVKSPQAKRAPKTRERMAKKAKVGDATMKQAMIVEAWSDLAQDVLTDKTSLNDAYKEARQREKASEADRGKPPLSAHMVTLVTHEGTQVPYRLPKGPAKFNRTNEAVGWARWTWGVKTGCLHDCEFGCYARELANRASYKEYYPVGFTPLFHHERLDAPKNTEVPPEAKDDPSWRRVFVCSMGDLFGGWVKDEWIEKVFAVCRANPQWEYLFLTKNPRRYIGLQFPPTAWVGTSVDTQKRVRVAEEVFRQIKDVRVKWLSLEPLLEPLEFTDLSMFDWVVIGALTATVQPEGAKPAFAPPFEWVARLTEQAHKAGCKVFQKANLLGDTHPQSPGMQLIQEVPSPPPSLQAHTDAPLPAA